MSLLEIRNLSKYFGGVAAITQLNLDIFDSEIVGLIGPNGAGKTTLFNVITGFFPPKEGKIIFRGQDITGLRPHQIAQRGIGRTFQQTFLFMRSTVLENILIGFHMNLRAGALKEFLHTPGSRKADQEAREQALEIIEFMGLGPLKYRLPEELSSGYQKALAVSIAFATKPKLLLLDEPVTTLSPDKVEMVMKLIAKVRDAGTTVVVIEHNMKAIMDFCDRIVVLAYGRKIAEGLPQEIRENKEVVEAYLGAIG